MWVRVRVRLRLGVRRARQLGDAVERLEEQRVARLEQERGLHLGAHLDWEYGQGELMGCVHYNG